jgi:hypothetical protein
MSGKTKAELEAEIQILERENVRLKEKWRKLIVSTIESNMNQNLKLEEFDRRIEKLGVKFNDRMAHDAKQIEKFHSGRKESKREADERRKFIIERVEYHESKGMSRQKARIKANEELKKEYGDEAGYEKSTLYNLIPAKPKKSPPILLRRYPKKKSD